METVPSLSSMARSSLLQLLELLSSLSSSLPGDSHSLREDMPCGESVSVACVGRLPAGCLPSWIVSPSCNESMCDSNRSHELADFCPMAEPTFVWNDVDGVSFSSLVKSCYDVVVHWRRNVFKVPFGKVGASFVREQARLFHAHDFSALETVALYAALIMPLSCYKDHPGNIVPGNYPDILNVVCLFGRVKTSSPRSSCFQKFRLSCSYVLQPDVCW